MIGASVNEDDFVIAKLSKSGNLYGSTGIRSQTSMREFMYLFHFK